MIYFCECSEVFPGTDLRCITDISSTEDILRGSLGILPTVGIPVISSMHSSDMQAPSFARNLIDPWETSFEIAYSLSKP